LRGGGDNAAAQRVAELEAELARMRGGQAPRFDSAQRPQAPGTQPQQQHGVSQQIAGGGLAAVNGILANIRTELEQLDSEENDPYGEDTSKRQRELFKLQAQALERIAELTVQTATSAERREREAREAAAAREEEARIRRERETTFAEMDAVGKDPELAAYKLPKPAVELEREYIQWRADVAAAYLGGPARSAEEENAALHQLEIKNPDLVNKCRLAGIAVEPTQGVNAYLSLVDALAYRDGWRPDPANPGQYIRMTRYDSATRREVPVVMADLAAAIKHKRLEDGEYKRQVDAAYQRGAQSFAAAVSKRDPAVGELNNPATIGGSGDGNADWASRYLQDVDADEVLRKFKAGDRTMLEDMNRARAVFGMAPMEFGG
jgi:hypothetical protein